MTTAVVQPFSHRAPIPFLPLLVALSIALLATTSTPPPLPPPPPPVPQRHESILRDELVSRIRALADITEHADREGVTRPFLSDAGVRTRAKLIALMRASRLEARVDAVGNVIGDLACPSAPASNASSSAPPPPPQRPLLLLGSHFDSVPDAGMWDGLYGLLSSIAVAHLLHPRICSLPFDIRVVGFDDEEGASPYGVTNFGSKAMSASLDLQRDVRRLDDLRARFDAVFPAPRGRAAPTLEQRVAAARLDTAQRRVLAFLEVHIEQGPVLEARRLPVGVVTAIAGQTRLSVTWRGSAAHAGTVPMAHRRDALAAAALGVSEVEAVAHGTGGLVATVGSLLVSPGAINVVPGEVVMTVDVRAQADTVRERAVDRIVRRLRDISATRGVGIDVQTVHEVPAVHMSPWVTEVLHDVVGGDARMMSGAGHDTQFMSRVTDVGMLFVRCRGGVSHSPDEFVEDEDAYRGAELLLKAVESIAAREAVGGGGSGIASAAGEAGLTQE